MSTEGLSEVARRLGGDMRSIYYTTLTSGDTVYVRAHGEEEAAEAFDVAGYGVDAIQRGRRDDPQVAGWDDVTPAMGDWFCTTARPERAFRVRAFTLQAAWRKARAAKVDVVLTIEPLADAKRRYEQQQHAKGE